MNKRRRQTLACVMIVALGMPVGCATNKPEMAWVRTDGRRIRDDPGLLKQGQTDIAVCNANLDAGVLDQGGRDCMAKKGYALVRKDQAEQARAGYATSPSSTAEAAIAECNEKRRRGELKSFKASVECSNPKIYAAWKEANDQNLDLLNVWLAARLVGAENVDGGKITEAEYQLQLAELNTRITEAKRRRSLSDAQANASLQATQAQSAAALLLGLAALQSANRPLR
jgi:hypothetical protein